MRVCSKLPLILFALAGAWAAEPQAATRDELDAFGLAFEASDSLARIRACENFLARYPQSEFREKVLELEFDAFEQRGDRRAVKRVGRHILESDPSNARILAALARLESSDNPALAESYARNALSAVARLRRPDDMNRNTWIAWKNGITASANLTLGLVALRSHKYQDSVTYLSEAVRIQPENAEWQHDLGLAYFEAKQLDDAETAFRRAHRIKPDLPGTLVFLGITELRLGKFAPAAKDLREAIVLNPFSGRHGSTCCARIGRWGNSMTRLPVARRSCFPTMRKFSSPSPNRLSTAFARSPGARTNSALTMTDSAP